MAGEGIGYGKVIIFNEHFVVYGVPAIVSAIEKYTLAKVDKGKNAPYTADDKRPEVPGYKDEKKEMFCKSVFNIAHALGIDLYENPVHIYLGGDLIAASGIGASAASCVAIGRAMAKHFGIDLNDDEVNNVAYEGEKAYHGNPSGIDNTASTYGGLIWFVRGTEGNIMERMSMPKSMHIVMANTGIVADTSRAVALVRERKEKEPEWFSSLASEAQRIAEDGRKALMDGDVAKVGELMNKNHEL
ncbi:MAG: mevalonate kinase, partial [Thermoplasmata archaeon]